MNRYVVAALAVVLGLLALGATAFADRTAITDPQHDPHEQGHLDIAAAVAMHSPGDHSRLVHKVTLYPLANPGPHDYDDDPTDYLGSGGIVTNYGEVCLLVYRHQPTLDVAKDPVQQPRYRSVCTQGEYDTHDGYKYGHESICSWKAYKDSLNHCPNGWPTAWVAIGPDTVRFSFPRSALGQVGRRYFWQVTTYEVPPDSCEPNCDQYGFDYAPDARAVRHQLAH